MSFCRDLIDDYKVNNLLLNSSVLTMLNILVTHKAWAITLIRIIVSDVFFIKTVSRFICYLFFHIEIGSNVSIGPRIILQHPTDIVIATGSVIGAETLAEKGGVHKGPNIGNNCVIGTGTVVVGNVYIGENTKIGPNSVVISDVAPNVIAFGNPLVCKNIKNNRF